MPRRRVLKKDFYAQPAEIVARELLGKVLVRRHTDTTIAARITETEAYVGPHDLACHGRFGCTPRTEVMFGPAGFWYVYLIYGMYWMLNVVTDEVEFPAAVLFRAAGEWSGPGRLTRGLLIDKTLNGTPADGRGSLWIEDRGESPAADQILVTPRIGIDYAGEWKDKPYRFLIAGSISDTRAKRKRKAKPPESSSDAADLI